MLFGLKSNSMLFIKSYKVRFIQLVVFICHIKKIYCRLPEWGYGHKTVNHGAGEYARDEDGDGFHEVHVNTMEGFWSLLRSWLIAKLK